MIAHLVDVYFMRGATKLAMAMEQIPVGRKWMEVMIGDQ